MDLWQHDFFKHFERADGVNWREFPGDQIVKVDFFQMNKKEKILPFDFLPAQVFHQKKKGDSIQFIYKNECYSFQIEQENEVVDDLEVLDFHSSQNAQAYFNIHSSLLNDKNKAWFDPHQYISHGQIFEIEFFKQFNELYLNKYKDFLGNGREVKCFAGVDSPISEDCGKYVIPEFSYHTDEKYKYFSVEMTGCEAVSILQGDSTISLIGRRSRKPLLVDGGEFVRKAPKDFFFPLEFKDGRSLTVESLENVQYAAGIVTFQILL